MGYKLSEYLEVHYVSTVQEAINPYPANVENMVSS